MSGEVTPRGTEALPDALFKLGEPGLLSSDEVAEIARTFAFDSDVKSQTIMRLVAHARHLADSAEAPPDPTLENHLTEMFDWVEGRKSGTNWIDDPAQCAVYDAMRALSHGIAALVSASVDAAGVRQHRDSAPTTADTAPGSESFRTDGRSDESPSGSCSPRRTDDRAGNES